MYVPSARRYRASSSKRPKYSFCLVVHARQTLNMRFLAMNAVQDRRTRPTSPDDFPNRPCYAVISFKPTTGSQVLFTGPWESAEGTKRPSIREEHHWQHRRTVRGTTSAIAPGAGKPPRSAMVPCSHAAASAVRRSKASANAPGRRACSRPDRNRTGSLTGGGTRSGDDG